MRNTIALLAALTLQVALAASATAQSETLSTRIGKLKLENGYPAPATLEKLYDEMEKKGKIAKVAVAVPALACKGFLDGPNEEFYVDP